MLLSPPLLLRKLLARAPLVLLAYVLLAGGLIWYSEKIRIEEEREQVASIAGEHALEVQLHIEEALSSAYSLATMVMLGKGKVTEFETVAAAMRSLYPGVAAMQLAPGGVIAQIEPLKGNEKALGHNLLADPERDKEALLAKNTGKMTLAGPFTLKQGGLGAAGRLPVFLKNDQGEEYFWGFVVVLLRFPEMLEVAHLPRLAESGYHYEVSRVPPDSDRRHVIATTVSGPLNNPVERALRVPNATWTLSVAPVNGWINRTGIAFKSGLALIILMMMVATGWRTPRAKEES
jgi:sensor domain CHASE-containing protein